MQRLHRPEIAVALALSLLLASLAAMTMPATAEEPINDAFQRTWDRTDRPVADEEVNRTWIWGPEGNTGGMEEQYQEADGNSRVVQYYDKARMEITTDPDVGPESPWYVTTGLLATELITGRLQLGNDVFQSHQPAQVQVAGDPTDEDASTYADLAPLMDAEPVAPGTTITATMGPASGTAADYGGYGVTAEYQVPETGHAVASVFWGFMNSEGLIYRDGELVTDELFADPFFATGFPITGAYWTTVEVDGEPTDVLVQAFERRVMTYTPDNPDGWKVETGNVGRHYYEWRYEQIPDEQDPEATGTTGPEPTATAEPSPTPTTGQDADCTACELEYGRGHIGSPGETPLGPDTLSNLTQPYTEVPTGDGAGQPDVSDEGKARLNFQETFSLVASMAPRPKDRVYYVVDFDDGSAFISGLKDPHLGFNVTHTWYGRGTYHIKIWTIDPDEDVRSQMVTQEMVVE